MKKEAHTLSIKRDVAYFTETMMNIRWDITYFMETMLSIKWDIVYFTETVLSIRWNFLILNLSFKGTKLWREKLGFAVDVLGKTRNHTAVM